VCVWILWKDIEKKNIVAVQSVRNMIMGSVFMANTSILLCCGLGAVISSTYRVKKPLIDSVYGAQGESVVALKYATIFTTFLFSFLFHSLSVRFLSQLSFLICLPQHGIALVTPEYLTHLLRKATVLNIVGNRLSHTGLFLLLWIFGPVMAFSFSLVVLFVFHKMDFVAAKEKINVGIA